jgi:hypothetical protein
MEGDLAEDGDSSCLILVVLGWWEVRCGRYVRVVAGTKSWDGLQGDGLWALHLCTRITKTCEAKRVGSVGAQQIGQALQRSH